MARATARASSERRESRSSTVLETARGPTARTTAAWSATGRTPSASSARRSWRSSSGLPPVASWHAAQNAGSASPGSRSRISAVVAARLSGTGPQREGRGVVDDLGEQAGVGARLCAAQRRGDQHGRPVQPPRQVGEVAQRGPVRPVQVVDREQDGVLRRQVEREPVEGVQRGERGGALLRGGRRGLEQRSGRGGRAGQLAAGRRRAPRRAGARPRRRTRARAPRHGPGERAAPAARARAGPRGGRTCRSPPAPRSARAGRCRRPRPRRGRRAWPARRRVRAGGTTSQPARTAQARSSEGPETAISCSASRRRASRLSADASSRSSDASSRMVCRRM